MSSVLKVSSATLRVAEEDAVEAGAGGDVDDELQISKVMSLGRFGS